MARMSTTQYLEQSPARLLTAGLDDKVRGLAVDGYA
jgi:hypothetical protein